MTPNKRDLKAFARFDGTGRIVPGSLVLRRSKPKIGKWTEVSAYACCNQDQIPVIVEVGGSFPITSVDFVIQPNDGDIDQYLFSYTGGDAANITALATLLNLKCKNIGHFKVDNDELFVTINANLAKIFVLNHTTSLSAFAFSD